MRSCTSSTCRPCQPRLTCRSSSAIPRRPKATSGGAGRFVGVNRSGSSVIHQFIANVRFNNAPRYLGRYADTVSAARAYDAVRRAA